MLTYVINTSENKTFDSSRLFELAGYSRIRWIQCSLNDIPQCVEYINERQNNIIADDFRIAVIVDFYGFDRIRIPYGRKGFVSDEGVDMSLYMPYLEVYLLDNLVLPLENKELYARDFEIYYVQNEKSERYDIFNSAPTQIRQILSGGADKHYPSDEELAAIADAEISDKEVVDYFKLDDKFCSNAAGSSEDQDGRGELIAKKVEMLKQKKDFEDLALYSSFILYCTPDITLEFPLKDYPYGALEMTFDGFWAVFRDRTAIKTDIRRHYYIVPYGGGPSRAALHTLSLSLYLIHMYEREESTLAEGNMVVEKIDSRALCEVLESGWSKINAAKIVAKKNEMEYYSLIENSIIKVNTQQEKEIDPAEAIREEKFALPKTVTNVNYSGEKLYSEIEAFAGRDPSELKNKNREEFDSIMLEYLSKRDETREADIGAEFFELKSGGFLKTTHQCPSKEQYNHLVNEKQQQISQIFEKVLTAEYIEVDYSEEKKRADEAYLEYKKAKAWTTKNIIGDIIFLLLTVASVILPYYLLQLTSYTATAVSSVVLALITSAFFAGLFVFSIVFQLIPIMHKLSKAKTKLYNCYLDCCAKEKYSFSAIRKRYENDLIAIEHTRYELRQLKRLYDENLEKEKTVLMHRKMLDAMSDCLSSMLSHLDVEPVFDESESVDGEFDLGKSLYARDNKVYQIFSLEMIEKIFDMKGRDLE